MSTKRLKKALVVDMTHGGLTIAREFSKLPSFEVLAWDIYHTLNDVSKDNLRENGVEMVDEGFLRENTIKSNESEGNRIIVVAPIHCSSECPVDMTHHEAVAFLMKESIELPFIEVTGVKGKTSVVHMLKEIFRELNPLILSSLGVEVTSDGESKLLKKDISITPASIIEARELAYNYPVGIFIAETSLGGTGLADVGVLTNIAEDYPIAKGKRSASQAKAQIFKSRMVACDYDSCCEFYPDFEEKTNTFGLEDETSVIKPKILNVKASKISYGLEETHFTVEVENLKTASGAVMEDTFEVSTFAPAPHHVQNTLAAICASLTLGASKDIIKKGLKNFTGLKGRTSITRKPGVRIIEEINPGINLTSIKKAIGILEDLSGRVVIFGGKYGVTCEEIDEKLVSIILNELNDDIELILTGELGMGLRESIRRDFHYTSEPGEAVDYALDKGLQNILLIYRSNFPDLNRR